MTLEELEKEISDCIEIWTDDYMWVEQQAELRNSIMEYINKYLGGLK